MNLIDLTWRNAMVKPSEEVLVFGLIQHLACEQVGIVKFSVGRWFTVPELEEVIVIMWKPIIFPNAPNPLVTICAEPQNLEYVDDDETDFEEQYEN